MPKIKDILIDGITDFPRDVVEKVIAFQGEDFHRAVKLYKEIEISGFGTLFIAKGKVDKRIKRWEEVLEKGVDKEKERRLREVLEFIKIKKCQLLKST